MAKSCGFTLPVLYLKRKKMDLGLPYNTYVVFLAAQLPLHPHPEHTLCVNITDLKAEKPLGHNWEGSEC